MFKCSKAAYEKSEKCSRRTCAPAAQPAGGFTFSTMLEGQSIIFHSVFVVGDHLSVSEVV
jgi:hypothetical protein